MRPTALLSLALGATCFLASAPLASATPSPGPASCNPHRALLRKGSVVVYERVTRKQDNLGGFEDGVFACIGPRGRAHLLGYDDRYGAANDYEYGPDDSVIAVKAAGGYAAAEFESGQDQVAQCEKYSLGTNGMCPPPSITLTAMAAGSGRSVSFDATDANGDTQPFAVSSAGALAWTDNGLHATRLHAAGRSRLRGEPRVLDSGPVSSFALSGLAVNWVDGGVSHSAPAP